MSNSSFDELWQLFKMTILHLIHTLVTFPAPGNLHSFSPWDGRAESVGWLQSYSSFHIWKIMRGFPSSAESDPYERGRNIPLTNQYITARWKHLDEVTWSLSEVSNEAKHKIQDNIRPRVMFAVHSCICKDTFHLHLSTWVVYFFSCPGQLNRWHCHSVSEWVSEWVRSLLISVTSEYYRAVVDTSRH